MTVRDDDACPPQIGDAVRNERIRALNDDLRELFVGGRVMITAGVDALPRATFAMALRGVMRFSAFTADNDPHGEHDFGALEVDGVRIFWKIDCYDHSLTRGSPDPADPAVSTRVLTIMLAEEW